MGTDGQDRFEIACPLYEREFGHGLDLHDAAFVNLQLGQEGKAVTMRWSLRLYGAPVGKDRHDARHYGYELRFSETLGSLDVLALAKSEIYRFDTTEASGARVEVRLVILPDGTTHTFTCAGIFEESLTPL